MNMPEEFRRFPKEWAVVPFTQVMEDATAGNKKIKVEDYLTDGPLPVVDQGQQLFGGYTADKDAACDVELPAIVFGDHTRIFKFIEQPFALGADGAKLLKPKLEFDKKFLFYYLSQLKIESAGYSRHFKFLKESCVPRPPLETQKQIAAVLEKADQLRKDRQHVEQELNALAQSVFLEMFGDPMANQKGWNLLPVTKVFKIKTGKLNSNAAVEGGKYPFFTCAQEYFWIDHYSFDQKAILLAGNNASADYSVKYYEGKFNAYQRTYVLSLINEEWDYRYFKAALEFQLNNLKRTSKGSNTKYLTVDIFDRTLLPVPDPKVQKKFSTVITAIEKEKENNVQQNNGLNDLFNSLLQLAFKGELEFKEMGKAA